MSYILLTVRFLDDRYHGLLDRGGPPEWPPSPFRLFQALVAGVARRGELVFGDDILSNVNFTPIGQALSWLQRRTRDHPPIIIAPQSKSGRAITRFVPNNDADQTPDRQDRLTAKPTIPTLFILEQNQKPEVHYVWDITDNGDCPIEDIERAARSLTALGWGVDMAFADARLVNEAELRDLRGVRWYPKKNAGSLTDTLRTPTYDDRLGECTLCDLRHCHSTFINRIEHGRPLRMVDKPKVFDRVLYASTERTVRRPHAVFRLLDAELEPTPYPHAMLSHIAAVARHAAIECMKDVANVPRWISAEHRADWVSRFVRGRNDPPRYPHQQISYVPLPSIGHEHADAMIRNVMLIAPIGCERELEHVAARLEGKRLEFKGDNAEECDTGTPPHVALPHSLQRFTAPPGKFIDTRYLGRSRIWQSVTPVVLDEHAKKVERKNQATGETDKAWNHDELIRKALERAGIDTPCRFMWQTLPFYKNCVTAHRYDRHKRANFLLPKRLDGKTCVHVRLIFEREVRGPLTIGAGRHCGFGLFAAISEK